MKTCLGRFGARIRFRPRAVVGERRTWFGGFEARSGACQARRTLGGPPGAGILMVVAVKSSEASAGADKPLRVGVIGAGVMGSNHARVFMTLPGVKLVGIADPLEVHRKRAV